MKFLIPLSLAIVGYCQPIEQGDDDGNSTQSITAEVLSTPSYQFSSFTYPPNGETTYAKGVSNDGTVTVYAPPYSELSHLHDSVSTTTWGSWRPDEPNTYTDSEDPYGQSAWYEMWESASVPNFTDTALYHSTVEPTPVPSDELILPPPDAFEFDDDLKFPKDFMVGVAGSASQIEGAVAEEGRTPTVMEKLILDDRPKNYITNENYYLYKQDIARIAAMGAKYYSFTIPWSRIMPFILPGTPVNQQAIDHYDDLINTCLEYGVNPVVTLTHFDSPLMFNGDKLVQDEDYPLHLYAGYANETFVDAFVNYGKIILTHYADRVPVFFGFNEPYLYAGYPLGVKHVVQAQKALHTFYHEEIKGCGRFGIKFNDNFGIPEDSENPEHVRAAERFQEFQLGSFGNPLFLGKDYPESWKSTFTDDTRYRLTEEELKEVSFGSDFFGIDPYTYTVVKPPIEGIDSCQANQSHPLWPLCVNETQTREDGWKMGYRSQSYVYITPFEFRHYLNYMWNTFKHPILVGEFGFPEWRESEKTLKDQLYDLGRSVYYRSFLDTILKAIHYDNIDVIGAFAWSFADNWEFGDYEQQFGIQVVNRTTQERYYKKSFFDYFKFYQDRS